MLTPDRTTPGAGDVEALASWLADLSTAVSAYLMHETDVTRPGFHATALVHAVAPLLAEHVRAEKEAAWDEGYSTCLGDFDIAARAGARTTNPYRSQP